MRPDRRFAILNGLLISVTGLMAAAAFVFLLNPQTRLSLQPLPTLRPTLPRPSPEATPPPAALAYPTLPPAWTAQPTRPPATPTLRRPAPTLSPTAPPAIRFGPENFPVNVNPLTGETVEDSALLDHRPLAVKIANTRPCARPQSGLNQAAVVFEHYVEAWGTRFTAIFYGSQVERIGPVRSARLIDLELPAVFDAVLVASGASGGVQQRLRASDFADRAYLSLGADCPPMCRVPQESVPCQDPAHTLYSTSADLVAYAAARDLDRRPRLAGWRFRTTPPALGRPATKLHVGYFNAPVDWAYDRESGLYLRSQDETRQVDALTGLRLTAANVVVLYAHHLYTDIRESTNFYSLEVQFWGQGRALLFRDGQVFDATWLRPSRQGLFFLVDRWGTAMPLKPGRTWFQFVPLNAAADNAGATWSITVPILPEQTPPRD